MNYKKLIIDSGNKMIDEEYTIETWGNISYRDPESNKVYLTPSGMHYATLVEDDIVVCDLDGTILESSRKPTIETELHLSVYRNRPDVNAVVHTHPINSTVFSCCGEEIPLLIDEAAQCLGGSVKTAPYALPGSPELAENCVQALGEARNACLLMSHGAVCVGENMEAAFRVAKVLEVTSEIYFRIRSMSAQYIPISDENIEKMEYFVKNLYGQR